MWSSQPSLEVRLNRVFSVTKGRGHVARGGYVTKGCDHLALGVAMLLEVVTSLRGVTTWLPCC